MVSQRARDTNGAFDALIDAVVSFGADANWPALAPASAPDSLGRRLGQGVMRGRRLQGATDAGGLEAPPLPAERINHEAQRSIAELGALLWHALDGPRDAPELARWLLPPNDDSIVALSVTRRRLAEYAVPEAVDRSAPFPGNRVWLVELEGAKGDTPAGVAVWRSRGMAGDWRTRCACIWTQGRIGSTTHPLVIGARWESDGSDAQAAACVVGPCFEEANRAANDPSRASVLARRCSAIGPELMARIVIPAAIAWLDAHSGVARPAGRFGADERARARHRPRMVHPVRALGRAPPPLWLGATPQRAAEAIVLRTAGEGWRVGTSCPVRQWRHGWVGYAELGAIAWHAVPDLNAPVDADTWTAMEHSLREGYLEAECAHPALAATSALVRKMLVQTGRYHVARAPDDRTLCALEIPARLWRALREAGPCPEPPAPPDLTDRWWLVEIEEPADDEPNLVALWEEDGEEVTLAAFLGVDDGAGGSCPTVVVWRTGADGRRSQSGVAVLRYPVHVDDPANAEGQAGARLVIDTLETRGTGTIARVRSAIALHLSADGEPTAIGPYRVSTAGAQTPRETAPERRGSFTALFALRRAPEPERGEDRTTAKAGHRHGARGPLLERHEVAPHWKRQAHGPRHSKRRWIVVERYERGPAPAEDQIEVTRLAERQRRSRERRDVNG